MLYQSFIALAAFLITLLGTRVIVLRLREKSPTQFLPSAPRSSGIAIMVALAAYMIATDASYALILSMAVLGGLAFLGEWVAVPPVVRLLTQLLVIACIVYAEQFSLGVSWLPAWVDTVLILLGWTWFVNLYETMDGIDGMATTEAICVTIGICLVLAMTENASEPLFIHSLIIAAAASGFLWWNWYPAKIRLGAVGSTSFSLVVGYALLSLVNQGYGISAFILASYFLMESLFTNLKPLLKDLEYEHYYRLAARAGTSHGVIVRHVFGANIMLIALAIFAALYPALAVYTLLAAILMVGIVLLFFERLYHRRSGA